MRKSLLFFVAMLFSMAMLRAQNCVGPTNLTATPHVPDYRNVTLKWTPVNDPQSQTVALSPSMALSTRIGWNGGSATNVVAATRYTTNDLAAYNGYQFTDVLFAPAINTSFATYEVVVFKGGSMNPLDTTFTPGTLIYSQPVTTMLTAGAVNTIPLNTPITIDASQELWVGIHIITLYGYPIYVTSASDATYHNQTLVGNSTYTTWHPLSVSSGAEYTWCIGMKVTNNANRPQGYMVYRNMSPLTPTPINGTTFVDSVDINGTIQYNVTALYPNSCESTPISATIEMDDDTCLIYDLPFTENFDSHPGSTSGTTNNLPECWHNIAGSYASYAGYPIIYNSSSYASSGTNSLRFYTTTSSTDYGYQVAILPPIDIMTYPVNTLQIEFDGRASATTSNFTVVVGVMDNYYDLSTFVPIDTFTSSSTAYSEFLTNFSQYTGNGAYIALMAPRDFASNYGYIDNIQVYETPSCPKPRDLATTASTQNSLTLTWNEMGSATEWEVEYGLSGFRQGSGTRVQALSNPVTITGLSASSTYDFYVRAVCGFDDTSMVAGPFAAITECGSISELPYVQNFDAFPGSTSTTGTTNLSQFCWSNINTGTTYPNYPIAYNSSTSANSGLNALRFYMYGSTAYSDQYAVMPALDPSISVNSLMMEYKARPYSQTSTYTFYVIIGVMSDSSDINTFVPVDTLLVPHTESLIFRDYVTLFNHYTGNGRYIAFKGVKPASTTGYNVGTIDDIVLSYIPTCMRPMDLTVTSYNSEEVTVNWQPYGSETSWEVAVVPAGSAPESSLAVIATEHPYTVNMLTPETEYDVYVRAYCGGNDFSNWTGPVSFKTRCAMTSDIPYEEHFDTYGTTTSTSATSPGPMPTCWSRITNNTAPYPYISSTQHIGVGALYLYSTTAYYSMGVSQQLDISSYPANSLYLTFKLKKTSASYGRLQVGVMTNPDSLETFVLLKNIYSSDLPTTSDWEEFTINLTEQYNTPIYLAFRSPDELTTGVYLDDVVLDAIPTCSEPRNLSVSQIQGTSAMVTWENALFGTPVYTVQYSELGMDNWSSPETTTGTFYMLSGLTPTTAYEVRVYSDCSTASSDTVSATFKTKCLIGGEVAVGDGTTTNVYLPSYSLYKHGYTQQIYTASELGGANTFKSLSFYLVNLSQQRHFSIYLMHTTATTSSDWLPAATAQLVYSGPQTLVANSWNTFNFTTPFVYNGTDNLAVIVIDANDSYTSGNSWRVHTAPSGTGAAKYTYNDATAYSITSVPTTTNGSSTASRNNVIFGADCDSVWVCVKPNVYVSSVSSAEIIVNWAAGNTESSWVVEYKADGDTVWTSEGTVYTNTYTFSNLNSGSGYQFRVCALCSSVDSSEWSTVSAFTPCEDITVLPYTQGFESASGSGAAYTVDPCLTRKTNSTTAWPYPSSTYAASGLYSLYFYGSTASYSCLALPRMAESIPMDSLMIQFKALKTSAAYYIEVGIMEDPEDVTTFTSIASFSPSMTSTTSNPNWEMGDCLTNTYTGTGRYVAFRIPQAATSYMYLDDIVVDYIPSCLHVTDLEVNNVTTNTAEISWTPGQDEQAWYYVYGKKDSVDLGTATYLTTTSNPLTLTGLEENTEYEVYVAADCNEPEPSLFMSIRFHTTCDPISSIPYYESFDEFGGVSGAAYYPNCWYRHNTQSTTTEYPYLYTTYSTSTPQSLYFYSLTSSTPATWSMAVVNELDPSISINTLQARFQLRTSSLSYYMVVGVLTDPENPNTFTAIDTAQNTATSTWEEFSIPLSSYTGQGRYIAFKGIGTLYFDDLWIEEIPNCDSPTDLVISNVTTTEATLTWTEGDSETAWEVYIVPEGTGIIGQTPYPVTNTPTLQVTSLNAASKYDVYLRAVCPGGGHSSYLTGSITTQCNPFTTIPFLENFDSHTGTTATATNNLPTCWNYINTGTSYAGLPNIYSSSTYAQSGTNSLRFYTYSTTAYSDQYAILPQFDNTMYPLIGLQLLFDARKYSASYPAILVVGVMSDPMDATTFDAIDTIEASSTTYEHFALYFNHYTGSGNYIAIMAPKLDRYNEAQVDNLEVSLAPSCMSVKRLRFENITATTADVLWTPNGSEYQWTLQYREQSGTDSTWLELPVSGMPQTTLTSLDANHTYEVRVQANCSGGESSDWSNVKVFTTECLPITTLPYSTDFDSYTGTTSSTANNLPDCWHYINRGTTYTGYPVIYNSSTYAVSGTNSLRFYSGTSSAYSDQYAILPAVDAVLHPVNTLQLEFDIKKYSTTYATFTMVVGVMTDPNDESTFVGVDTVVVPETTAEHHTTYFNSYTGNGTYIALVGLHAAQTSVTINSGSVDNLSLSVMPNCPPVQDVTVSNVSENSADISWTPNGDETAWWVKYKANAVGAVADSVYVTSTTHTLTNLSPNTSYMVQIQSDCGLGETSIYTAPVVFTTECTLLTTLPFSTNFDTYSGSTSGTTNNLPDCWHHLNTGTLSTYAGYPIIYNSSTYSQSGSNSLRFYTYTSSSTMGDQYAVLPGVDATQYPMNTLQVEFDIRKYSTTYATFTLQVGVMTDPYDLSTFELVDTLMIQETTYSHRVVKFDSYQGIGAYVTLMAPKNAGVSYNAGNIDNLTLKVIPCSVPESLAVSNVTATSATVAWTPTGAESTWNLQYKTTAATSWTLVPNLTSTSYTLTNLQPNTQYQVQVQANCGTEESDWSASVSFTTMDDQCAAPTNLHLVDTTMTTATLDWNQSSGVTNEWTVYYKKSGEDIWSSVTTNTHPYELVNLESGKTYMAQVTAHCTNGVTSDPSESITFTTSTVGVEHYELEHTEVYPNPTTGQFRIQNTEVRIQSVEVFDVYAKLMYSVEVNDNTVTVDASNYASGVYFIRINTDKGLVNRRIVKK